MLFAALENFVTIKNHFTAATGSQNATGMHGNLNIMTVVRPAGRTCKVLIKCLCIANHNFNTLINYLNIIISLCNPMYSG